MKKVVIKSEEKRLVYGEVYAPLHIDTDNEAMTAEEIEKMAHNFLMKMGSTSKIDVQHNFSESGCLVVESFIARKNDPDEFIEGSWVLGVKILPDEVWEAVQKGELNGFSFAGNAESETIRTRVSVTKKMAGSTERSKEGLLPEHNHFVEIEFGENSEVIKGSTDIVLGHKHKVLKTTATEKEMDHSHRLVLV
jgi:hypothetical protein